MDELDSFFDYNPGRFCIIHNWVNRRKQALNLRPKIGNSSVFRFDAGPISDTIYKTFLKEIKRAEDTSIFNTEQAFMTYAMKDPLWWPETWVRSYKWNCRPAFPLNLISAPKTPRDCKILVFHGKPDPEEAIIGFKGKKMHHSIKAAPWIQKHWY